MVVMCCGSVRDSSGYRGGDVGVVRNTVRVGGKREMCVYVNR